MKYDRKDASLLTLLFFFYLFSASASATPYYGVTFSYAAKSKEPSALHGYQLMFSYDPQWHPWYRLRFYFDGGFSHFFVNNQPNYTSLNIYSIAPIVRLLWLEQSLLASYLDLSIGAAYLNHTHIANRNLGIHYAFQDRIGVGLLIGHTQQLIVGIHAVHYSNAHLSVHNSGITIPLILDIGYRFQ